MLQIEYKVFLKEFWTTKSQTHQKPIWWVPSGPVGHFAFPLGIVHLPLTDKH